MPQSLSPPEFFLDRSLGGHNLAAALRVGGWIVRTHIEVYGNRDEQAEDVEWLALCGQLGWSAITMDRRIRYRPTEIAAVRRHRVRLFALTNGNLTAARQADRLLRNNLRIQAACAERGPFVYAVRATQIARIFP